MDKEAVAALGPGCSSLGPSAATFMHPSAWKGCRFSHQPGRAPLGAPALTSVNLLCMFRGTPWAPPLIALGLIALAVLASSVLNTLGREEVRNVPGGLSPPAHSEAYHSGASARSSGISSDRSHARSCIVRAKSRIAPLQYSVLARWDRPPPQTNCRSIGTL